MAFVGQEAILLMYLQEPPRGDGASGSAKFLFLKAEIVMSLIYSLIMWYHAISTSVGTPARRELVTTGRVHVYHMIEL